MQLILLALVLGIFVHDAFPEAAGASTMGAAALLALVFVPKLALGALYHLACIRTWHRLAKPGASRALQRLDRLTSVYRVLVLGLYATDLLLGWLTWLRIHVGNWVLVDELLVMLPPLALLVWQWWAYYPLERRLREAALIGRLDAGLPIYPVWTRTQYLLAQLRHQVALILAPLLIVLAWAELVQRVFPARWPAVIELGLEPVLMMLGAGTVFLFAPLIIRHLWDTVPMPAGELRDRLLAMCQRHRVGVRELLLWRTFGGMINAAVMGLVAPLRYILLTDALVEMVHRDQVEAVMAHELAHVKRHHMFWLLVAAIGSLGVVELVFTAGYFAVSRVWPMDVAQVMLSGMGLGALPAPMLLLTLTAAGAGLSWAAIFGWVSRRFERQADTFAVQHLATGRDEPARDAQGRVLIDPTSAQTMILALQQVAELNHVPAARRSWRHGSIAWRQAHLRNLVGRPAERLAIDRQMRWIKLAAAAALVLVVTAYVWLPAIPL